MKPIETVLDEIYNSVPNIEFISIINTEEGVTMSIRTDKWNEQGDIISAALSEIARTFNEKRKNARNAVVKEILHSFIAFLIETENSYFVFTQIKDTNFFVGAAINKNGNVGLLRSKIKLYEDIIGKNLP